MKKIIKILGIIFCVLIVYIYFWFPWGFRERGSLETSWWNKTLYIFCKYKIPLSYTVASYDDYGEGSTGDYVSAATGPKSDQFFIQLTNHNSEQIILITRPRGFRYVNLESVQIKADSPGKSFSHGQYKTNKNFDIYYHLPFFPFLRQRNLLKLPTNLILKGIDQKSKKRFDTENASILYIEGDFQRIGFFKKMKFPMGFEAPVYNFRQPLTGALAIVTSNKSKESIMVISSVPRGKEFDEKILIEFLNSISFDKEIYDPPFLKGPVKTEMNLKINN